MDFESIPGPRGLPFIGNLLDLRDDEAPLRALERLADIYGSIYRITMPSGQTQIVLSSAALMKEVMDEKRFIKPAIQALHRPGGADGLIVAGTQDPDWEQGHRILRPAFGPIKIDDMFDDMRDIAHQLVLKWARFGDEEEIAITEDFSNLTLDTIALCTMSYRFNSFYRDGMHPFVAAMMVGLGAAGQRGSLIPLLSTAMSLVGFSSGQTDKEELVKAQQYMQQTSQRIIDERRSHPTKKSDFLNALLYGEDPKTGKTMRDQLIISQMSSFLVAGHETTSGLLSFAVIFLLQNPETYRKAQVEVDKVVGGNSVTLQHIRNLKYLYAVLQETLRLVPTAPTISKIPHPNLKGELITLGGKYKLEPTDRIRVLLGKSMQDPKVFGEDARDFNPERMLESNPDYPVYESYWRPFSQGSRACLGRPFSLQEAMLALTLILQNFDLRLTDPMYQVRIKQNLTVKPLGLYVKAGLRNGMSPIDLERRLHNGQQTLAPEKRANESNDIETGTNGTPLNILYGSNTGTCQALAQRLASEASTMYGFNPTVNAMDTAVDNLPKDSPTIIITSSYEGEPPDNALQFVKYLESLTDNELAGIKYAVFGCGHHDWHATFHRIPNLVNDVFKARRAEQITGLGLSDVSQGNPMNDFESWLDKELLPKLQKLFSKSTTASPGTVPFDVEADISTGERAATLHQDLEVGTVRDSRILTAPGEQPEKRHLEIDLPAGSTYECGDYVSVLPQNPEVNVRAVMSHFQLPADANITLKSKIFSPLPLNTSLSVSDLLRNYYELAKPATRRGVALALRHAKGEETRAKLSGWLEDEKRFYDEVTGARLSIFDLLNSYTGIAMPFPAFLSLLPPLGIRQYSISSSPLRDPERCTITYSVVTDEKNPNRPFYGVATTYLSGLKRGDKIQVAIRRTAKAIFRLPLDAETTPLLMFAAGSGLAPFRGFIEQRAIQLEAQPGMKLAPAHLFLGCRSPERDRIYANEIDTYERTGAVKVYYSFSQDPDASNGCKYVSDRMLREVDIIARAWMDGARAYTCGNRAFAESVGAAARQIVDQRLEHLKSDGSSTERVEERKAAIFKSFSERAADDVFD